MSAPRHRRRRLALIAGLATFALLAGSSAGWAYWTSQASVTAPASAANLTVTTANFGSVSATAANEALVSTGSVTVTHNTSTSSTRRGAVTVQLSATGANAYRGNFTVAVWRATTANPCTAAATPGTALASGTWANPMSFTTLAGDGFVPGESRTYCVRTTAVRTSASWPASGSMTFTPRVDASIAIGNYSGASNASATVTSQYLYPLHLPTAGTSVWNFIHGWNTGGGEHCLDHFSGEVYVGGWQCKDTGVGNQAWRFADAGGGYFTIVTNVGGAQVMQQAGTAVNVVNAVAGSSSQQWTLQTTATVSGTRATYQIVNRASGQCLTKPLSNGAVTMENCDGGADQRYLVARTMFTGTNGGTSSLSCSVASAGGPNSTTYSIVLGAGMPNARYEVRLGTSTSAVASATTNGSGAATITIPYNDVPSDTAITLVQDSGASDPGTRVGTGALTRGTWTAWWFGSYWSTQPTCSVSSMG